MFHHHKIDFNSCANQLKQWGQELGFQQVGITSTELPTKHEQYFFSWLKRGYHGSMAYLAKHGYKRTRPALLIPKTIRIIMARINYLPPNTNLKTALADPTLAAISNYALGKDYHFLLRSRLKLLAEKLTTEIGPFNYRVFTDSGPVMEKSLATQAGLGWFGKHTILLNRQAGSYFFLGTIYTDLPLPIDEPTSSHCGSCQACITACPTKAIIAPYQLNATKCISYLTIEHRGIIPLSLRKLIGNRIFGCDDCQLVCPWNKFAKITNETAFFAQINLTNPSLLDLFNWSENDYLQATINSPIRRVGYLGWLRNLAIALGNAPYSLAILSALEKKLNYPADLVQIHVKWAITQQVKKCLYTS